MSSFVSYVVIMMAADAFGDFVATAPNCWYVVGIAAEAHNAVDGFW